MPAYEMLREATIAMLAFTLTAGIAWAGISGGTRDPGKVPATQPAKPPVTAPAPELSPQQVVKAVMTALRTNDADDSGIRTTFNFASPGNKEVTGPVDRFIPLVKSPAYLPMVNHRAAEYGPVDLAADHAQELVIVTTATGEKAFYIFQLSRQTEGEFKNCWMTDGVFRVQPPDAGDPPPQPRPDGDLPVKT